MCLGLHGHLNIAGSLMCLGLHEHLNIVLLLDVIVLLLGVPGSSWVQAIDCIRGLESTGQELVRFMVGANCDSVAEFASAFDWSLHVLF